QAATAARRVAPRPRRARPQAGTARERRESLIALFARSQARGSSAGYPDRTIPGRERGPARCAAPAEGLAEGQNSP
ncbi:MAG: hypothetical protein AAF732_00005, partial [Pseudomonadota bacterium]